MARPLTASERAGLADGARDLVAGWNRLHPIGTPVRYWPGFHEGEGRVSTTRSKAWNLNGRALVAVDGYPGGIDLTHVEPQEGASCG